jgi:hypothetical protein
MPSHVMAALAVAVVAAHPIATRSSACVRVRNQHHDYEDRRRKGRADQSRLPHVSIVSLSCYFAERARVIYIPDLSLEIVPHAGDKIPCWTAIVQSVYRNSLKMYDPSFRMLLEVAFGPGWRRRAEVALGRSRRTIQRWCSGETRVPRRALVLLERLAGAAGSDIERWRRARHERIEKEAFERLAAAGQALTWAKLLTLRDEREPRPTVGRQRERAPVGQP